MAKNEEKPCEISLKPIFRLIRFPPVPDPSLCKTWFIHLFFDIYLLRAKIRVCFDKNSDEKIYIFKILYTFFRNWVYLYGWQFNIFQFSHPKYYVIQYISKQLQKVWTRIRFFFCIRVLILAIVGLSFVLLKKWLIFW